MTDTTKTEALPQAWACAVSWAARLPLTGVYSLRNADILAIQRRLSAVEAELEKERKARQDAQRQRADDYAHLMAEAKMEQRGRGRAEAERDRLAAECEALRAEHAPTPEDIDAQDWAGMDAAIAFHLIERHGEDWGHCGRLMNAWLQANAAAMGGKE